LSPEQPSASPLARLFVHTPPRQNAVDAHSESLLQPPVHAVPEQVLGEQLWLVAAGHVAEEPLHTACSWSVVELRQVAAVQTVPAWPAGCWHPPFTPSH
jgi:hypothetical protein